MLGRSTVPLTEPISEPHCPNVEPAAERSLAAGTIIANYRVIRHLGTGGMGEVYLARDLDLGREVAIKLLLERSADNMARFLAEARLTAQCQHEHIVTIHQVGEYRDRLYMVLEYLRGKTLYQLVHEDAASRDRTGEQAGGERGGAMPARRVIELMLPVARALAYAHERGIVHRDLTPANIMLTDAGTVKVLDFGIATLRSRTGFASDAGGDLAALDATSSNAGFGTLPYVSPEQLRGESIDHRGDIWAMGIMLHELVLGAHPLAPFSLEMLPWVADPERALPSAGERVPGLGPIIDRCLDKRLDARMGSARELCAELEQLAAAEPATRPWVAGSTSAHVPDSASAPLEQARSLAPMRRSAWSRAALVLVLALALLAAGVAGFLLVARRSPPAGRDTPAALSTPATTVTARIAAAPIVLARFVNHTDEPDLGRTLDTLLRIGLEQSPHVHVLSVERTRVVLERMARPADAVVDRALGLEVAERAGAGALIVGSVARMDARYLLSAEVVGAQANDAVIVESAVAESRAHLFEAMDVLVHTLRRRLGESHEMLRANQRALADVTTSDIDALRAYTQALEKADKYQLEEAEKLLLQAVARDPDFAMAHAKLGLLYYYPLQQRTRALEHWRAAMAQRERLSPREALHVEGSMAWENEPAEMARIWNLYAALYPDSSIGHSNLGYVYWWYMGRPQDAAAAFARSVELDPTRPSSHTDLGYVLLALGRYEDAIASFQEANRRDEKSLRVGLVDAFLAAGQHRDALRVLRDARDVPASSYPYFPLERELKLTSIYADQEQWQEARAAADRAVRIAGKRGISGELARSLVARAALAGQAGDKAMLRADLERARDLLLEDMESADQRLMSLPVTKLAIIGTLYARHGYVDMAEAVHRAISPKLEAHDVPLWAGYAALLEGETQLARSQPEAAVATLRNGLAAVALFQLHVALSRALLAAGLEAESSSEATWVVEHRGQAISEWLDSFYGRELNVIDWGEARRRLAEPGAADRSQSASDPD